MNFNLWCQSSERHTASGYSRSIPLRVSSTGDPRWVVMEILWIELLGLRLINLNLGDLIIKI